MKKVLLVVAAIAAVGAIAMWFMPTALTQANFVPPTKASQTLQATSPNTLKPAFCNPITLTAKIAGSGNFSGNANSELIVGSANNDNISGVAGSDCILAGAGDDTIDGGEGDDYLIGGPGNDTCVGGLGQDVFDSSCEVPVQ